MVTEAAWNSGRASRRTVLKTGLAAAAVLKFTRTGAAADPVTFVSWGGPYNQVLIKTICEPFTKETGIPVQVVLGPDLAKAKAQVKLGNVEWDVFDAIGPQAAAGERDGLWDDLTGIADPSAFVAPPLKTGLPFIMYPGGIGYVPSRLKGSPPKVFSELWNVKDFPGRRAFMLRASENLEAALLADGVDPKKLYPLDVDRAFKSLDKIKPHVVKWIESSPQIVGLLQNNEVDYCWAYSARVLGPLVTGTPLGFSFDQTIISCQYATILKGTPRREQALKFVRFMMQPQIQANLATGLLYIPGLKKSVELLSPEAKTKIPNLDDPRNIIVNIDFWADNNAALEKRFREWLAV